MEKFERIVGNILASILLLLVAFSIFTSIFNLLFRDGKGSGMYGSRGEYYMSE